MSTSVWLSLVVLVACLAAQRPPSVTGQSPPLLYAVSGCVNNTGNATYGCDGGVRVLVTGSNFSATASVIVSSQQYRCSNVSYWSSSQLSCQLPYMPASVTTAYAMAVSNDGRLYSPWTTRVTFRSQLPVIDSVKGCADDSSSANGTAGCVAGQLVSIRGSQFLDPSLIVQLIPTSGGIQYASGVTVRSPTLITCLLPPPFTSGWYNAISVSVRSSNLYSVSKPYITYVRVGPWIDAVSGCALDTGNSTARCNGGDWVTIRGSNFSSNSLQAFSNSYRAPNVSYVDNRTIRAQLPYIPLVSAATVTVQVSCSGISSNSPSLVGYDSQVPLVTAISGCPNTTANATSGCAANATITVTGQRFLGGVTVTVSSYVCTTVAVLSSSRLTCRLPSLSVSAFTQPQWLRVLAGNGLYSSYSYLLSYGTVGTISSVRGCAATAGSGASGCTFNDTIFIRGSNLPTGRVSVFLAGSYETVGTVSYNSSVLSARLPYIYTTGRNYTVQVWNSTAISPTANGISYVSQVPVIWRVTGCAVDNNRTNSTAGCMQGMAITVEGSQFPPPPSSLALYINDNYLATCTFISRQLIRCVLPNPGYNSYNRLLTVQLYSVSGYSNSPYLVMYSAPSSSSTGRFVASTGAAGGAEPSVRRGLSVTELVIVICVVVVVVGSLLVCQVLYCLHHFAGVKFPRLARLTGGRLFAAEADAAAGIHLGLLEHDHHQQQGGASQSWLRAEHPQPQAALSPPTAASPYQPALHQLTTPSVPASFHVPTPSAPGPGPLLYPRSFVPSMHHYQPVS